MFCPALLLHFMFAHVDTKILTLSHKQHETKHLYIAQERKTKNYKMLVMNYIISASLGFNKISHGLV